MQATPSSSPSACACQRWVQRTSRTVRVGCFGPHGWLVTRTSLLPPAQEAVLGDPDAATHRAVGLTMGPLDHARGLLGLPRGLLQTKDGLSSLADRYVPIPPPSPGALLQCGGVMVCEGIHMRLLMRVRGAHRRLGDGTGARELCTAPIHAPAPAGRGHGGPRPAGGPGRRLLRHARGGAARVRHR